MSCIGFCRRGKDISAVAGTVAGAVAVAVGGCVWSRGVTEVGGGYDMFRLKRSCKVR